MPGVDDWVKGAFDMTSKDSPNERSATFNDPTRLTPSEIKSLREHKRKTIRLAHWAFDRMEAEAEAKAKASPAA